MAAAYPLRGASGRLPEVDGLRAISIMLVVASHAGLGQIVPGGFGVDVFFVISGFVITRLLLAEEEADGGIDLLRFYMRRAQRLYPALLVFILMGLCLLLATGGAVQAKTLGSALFYWANYQRLAGMPTGIETLPHPFGVLWSLSIEEHFYLLFPLLLLLTRRRSFVAAVLVIMAASPVWRLAIELSCDARNTGFMCLGGAAEHNYAATDARLDAILPGCLLAWLVARPASRRLTVALRGPVPLVLGGILVVTSLGIRDEMFRNTLRYSFQAVGVALVLSGVLYGAAYDRLRNALRAPWLVLLGRMSYVLYLMHWLGLGAACWASGTPVQKGIYPWQWYTIYLAGSVLLTFLVYYGVERPAARLRGAARPLTVTG